MIKFPEHINTILVTGGSGFIGGALIRRLLRETTAKVFNLDKFGYASDFDNLNKNHDSSRYQILKVDLSDTESTQIAIKKSNPDIVFHLAAESHVDKSIEEAKVFLESNVVGTFNLLQAIIDHWKHLTSARKNSFLFLHVSTDEVYGSANKNELFTENTAYDPRSPYSATKAASDHLVSAWNNTFGLPTITTHSCNNFGPRQFPEKFIPVIIKNALKHKNIPIYGDGKNIRDWIYVEDHVDALIQIILKGRIGDSYCIGGYDIKTNDEIVEVVCNLLDKYNPKNAPHIRLKKYVKDRPGHDRRYAINNKKLSEELGWKPQYNFSTAIDETVKWYLKNNDWLNKNLI